MEEDRHAEIRVHVQHVQETVRADHDDLGVDQARINCPSCKDRKIPPLLGTFMTQTSKKS
jgi:hypothetical protein